MKNLDCNQIIIFINLEIIREEDKDNIYIYIYLQEQFLPQRPSVALVIFF